MKILNAIINGKNKQKHFLSESFSYDGRTYSSFQEIVNGLNDFLVSVDSKLLRLIPKYNDVSIIDFLGIGNIKSLFYS